MVISWFIHVAAGISTSYLSIVKLCKLYLEFGCTSSCLSIMSDEHFSFFQLLAIMNNAALKICMQAFVWTNGFILWCKDDIVGLCGNSIFYILRKWQTVFKTHCKISISQCPCQHLLLSVFFIIDITISMK